MTTNYETQSGQIETGWDVYDVNGDEIGDVSEVGPNYIVVEKGWLFPTDIYIPNSAITSVAPDRIQLNVAKDAIDGESWNSPPADQGFEGQDEQRYVDTSAAATSDYDTDATLERREERLQVGKEAVQTGEVRVGKEVIEEQESIDVPVTRESVEVSTRSVDRPATGAAFEEGEISIPVSEERVTVDKEARVVEELEVDKVARQDTERVTDTVRREEFRIDDEGTSRRQ